MKHRMFGLAIVGLFLLIFPLALADTAVFSCNKPRPGTRLMTISEGPDPVDSSIWTEYDSTDGGPNASIGALNASGAERDDGAPVLAFGANAWPYAIWAYNTGIDHDIAFSEWNGCGWTATTFLTSTTDDELDPHLHVDRDANLYAVWWVDDPVRPRVMISYRGNASASWTTPIEITGELESGRRPSVAAAAGHVAVAYERLTPLDAMAQAIVVASVESPTSIVRRVVGSTNRTKRLDPVVEMRDGKQWVSWKQNNTHFGWALVVQQTNETGEAAIVWGATELESWTDPSWVGVGGMRALVRRTALRWSPDDPDVFPIDPLEP